MSVAFRWNEEDFNDLVRSCDRDPSTPYILNYMPSEGKILEAGCGLARYVEFLSKRGIDIVGIELNQNTVDTVRKLAPWLDVRQGDVSRLPFEDNSISGIISLGVIEHFIEGPGRPLMEMLRVLRPGYYAVITVPSFNYIRRIKYKFSNYHINPIKLLKAGDKVCRLLSEKPLRKSIPGSIPYKDKNRSVSDRFFEYLFTQQEFEQELRRVGFTIVESVPIALIDGIYHEFGRTFVSFSNWSCHPNIFGKLLNYIFGKIPFCHNHMHLCVAKK